MGINQGSNNLSCETGFSCETGIFPVRQEAGKAGRLLSGLPIRSYYGEAGWRSLLAPPLQLNIVTIDY
ncbi:MAG: hypothetical protein JRD05_11420 [Deltaproteobacteria bacterium]|nr:hypothetical protein [Deltaproteobacteria bacterium]